MPSTGVLMRLLEIQGDDYSIDEVILPPGIKANWLRFPETLARHRVNRRGVELEIVRKGGRFDRPGDRRRRPLSPRRAAAVYHGQWHRLINTSEHPATLEVTLKPSWNPQRAFFRLGNREYQGDEVFFEVKTHLGDRTSRAMYQLHELGAELGNVSVLLAPGTETLESFHEGATVVVTSVEGSGIVRIDGRPQEMEAGGAVVVEPGQRYQLQNPTNEPWRVNQVHEPQWEPEDTFYVDEDRIIPATQVWFEFAVPD